MPVRVMTTLLRKRWWLTAALFGLAISLSASVMTQASASGSKNGGTVTFAQEIGAPPTYIFPLEDGANSGNNNITYLQPLMWRPLFWFGHSNSDLPTINYSLSLAKAPTWSNGGRTVTVNLNHYLWSNGTPVTTRDVEFWMNLLKANEADYVGYAPGWWMDEISSIAYTSSTQFSITFNGVYSESWLIDNGLSEITPIPQYAWDKTSAGGSIGDYDRTTSGATAVYNYLNSQSTSLSTWDTNPLWQVVDGPFRLQPNHGFDPTTGLVVMVPNKDYSGPIKPKISKLEELPFTSGTAEIDAVLAGRVDYGYVPFTDLNLKSRLEKSGYRIDTWLDWGFTSVGLTFPNRQVGSVLEQLYVRQAMQHLINEPEYIKKIFDGYAEPTYGPVPVYPKTEYVSSYVSKNPLPYDPSAAKKLLTEHGWHVVPGGTSSCAHPGTGASECGAGIAKGTALKLNMLYSSGNLDYTDEMEAMQSSFSAAGIQLVLKSAPFDSVLTDAYSCVPATGSGCGYGLEYLGSPNWTYVPVYYPSGDPLIEDTGIVYPGDPAFVNTILNLITTSHAQPGLPGLHAYENYVAKEVPYLWMPNAAYQISVISNKLKGITAQDTTGHIYPENWILGG
ncbi:MAG TPA: ABC transporter substrate-binding protein [Candidatus Dormibacteraeota bacterium]